jgi:hypothetical protein
VTCGNPLVKIVRTLYKDNYCIEKCKRCNEVSDKYAEYENNLKIISVVLCFTQIHRHIYFNIEHINNIRLKCFSITIILLFFFYLHESKMNYRKYLEQ